MTKIGIMDLSKSMGFQKLADNCYISRELLYKIDRNIRKMQPDVRTRLKENLMKEAKRIMEFANSL